MKTSQINLMYNKINKKMTTLLQYKIMMCQMNYLQILHNLISKAIARDPTQISEKERVKNRKTKSMINKYLKENQLLNKTSLILIYQ